VFRRLSRIAPLHDHLELTIATQFERFDFDLGDPLQGVEARSGKHQVFGAVPIEDPFHRGGVILTPAETEASENTAGFLQTQIADKVPAKQCHGVHVVENQPATLESKFPVVETDEFFKTEILCFHGSVSFKSN
jgi:hypothetical protein